MRELTTEFANPVILHYQKMKKDDSSDSDIASLSRDVIELLEDRNRKRNKKASNKEPVQPK